MLGKVKSLFAKLCPETYSQLRAKRSIKSGILNQKIWGEVVFKDEIEKVLTHLQEQGVVKEKTEEHYIQDMVQCYLDYGITPEEYRTFNFHCNPSFEYRNSFLSIKNKDILCLKKEKGIETFNELENKDFFYSICSPFFSRDFCSVKTEENEPQFIAFCKKHEKFILKPNMGQCGKGIRIISLNEYENLHSLFQKLLEEYHCNGFVVEELIIQTLWMSEWNRTSVNTMRVPSIRTKNGIHIFKPYFRFGRKGAIVDNGHSGGFAIVVNPNTGIMQTNAVSASGDVLIQNPSNGLAIIGSVVPRWDELKALVEKVHQVLPENHHYVGFDMALTDNGWVLIEGNWGTFDIPQYVEQKGCRKEFEELMLNTI